MISNTLDNMLDKALKTQEALNGITEEFKDRLDFVKTLKYSRQREIYDHVMKKLEIDSEENNNIRTKINTLISILEDGNKTLDETSQISDEIRKILNTSRMSTLETLSNKALMGNNVMIDRGVGQNIPIKEVLKQQDLKVNPLGGKSKKERKNKKSRRSRRSRRSKKNKK
jgi:predicted patatin/cPLA2 family phospholipase